jgi:hypothetical protein
MGTQVVIFDIAIGILGGLHCGLGLKQGDNLNARRGDVSLAAVWAGWWVKCPTITIELDSESLYLPRDNLRCLETSHGQKDLYAMIIPLGPRELCKGFVVGLVLNKIILYTFEVGLAAGPRRTSWVAGLKSDRMVERW